MTAVRSALQPPLAAALGIEPPALIPLLQVRVLRSHLICLLESYQPTWHLPSTGQGLHPSLVHWAPPLACPSDPRKRPKAAQGLR